MNRLDFRKLYAKTREISQLRSKTDIDAFMESVSLSMRDEDGFLKEGARLTLTGFGTFFVRKRTGKAWTLTNSEGITKSGLSEDKLFVVFKPGNLLLEKE